MPKAQASAQQLRHLQHQLEQAIAGEVRCDPYSRVLYSTDASIYQIEPLGVVFPRHADDLPAIVEIAGGSGVPLLPRGAGTSLSGQAVGPCLVIDCSRHLHHILDIDPETRQAVVEPGVVGAALQAAAAPHGLMFGPDPASADRATIGGMIGNNATGAHSIRYGMTADHLLEAEVVLDDGSCATLQHVTLEQAEHLALRGTRLGSLVRELLDIRQRWSPTVQQQWPRIWRRASGYSLDYLVGHHPSCPQGWYAHPLPYPFAPGRIPLPALMCGAEGTLAVLRRATVNLVARPAATILRLLEFSSVYDACAATPEVLATRPAAVEVIPRTLIDRARTMAHYAHKARFLASGCEAFLVAEYTGDSSNEALAQARALTGRGIVLESPEDQAELWQVRKAGVGLLLSAPGDAKPISFIEDVAVPVERLAEYVRRIDALLAKHGTRGEWYGHASAGCLHMRPRVNLKTGEGVARMRAIAEEALALVVELGGVLSGEHGDGLAHTEFQEFLFGPDLTSAFRQLKRAFDPQQRFNPGKVVPVEGHPPPRLDASLRYGPDYRTLPLRSVYAFRRQGSLAHAIEDCNGAGVCLQSGGVMCPSYQATREEMDSTRGRANALRAAISGRLPADALTSREMYRVLDLCLQCKGCQAECPSGVDMARIKGEFLELHHAQHGVPLRSLLFGEIAAISRWLAIAAPLVNWVGATHLFRWFLEETLGISLHRRLPRLARRSFRQWFARRPEQPPGEPVVLFVDTFTNYNHPEIGQAAVKVLEALGRRVLVAKGQGCCGRAMISKGLLRRAKSMAKSNLAALEPYLADGTPIVGLEPSCVATLRDEYLDFYPDDPRASALAAQVQFVEEFLLSPGSDGIRPVDRLHLTPPQTSLVVHGHCQGRAVLGENRVAELMRATGAPVKEVAPTCCGMAGSFGYEKEHYCLSMQIGEMRLFPAVRDGAQKGAQIVAAGTSCRTQILDGTGVPALHPVEVLAQLLPMQPDTGTT